MKRSKVFVFAVLCLAVFGFQAGCCQPPKLSSVGVNIHPQQRDWWCWAACTEMVSEYYGHRVIQCDSANYVHNKDHDPDVECCTGCKGDCPCWGSAWGAFIDEIKDNWTHWKFNYTYVASSLSWEDLKSTVSTTSCCGKSPIYVVIPGHVVVIYGYAEINGNKYISYFDPWEPNCEKVSANCQDKTGGADVVTTYDAFLNKWKHSFYKFSYVGP